MFKQHKLLIIITSIVTLLPVAVGLAMWNILPDKIAIHFNTNGVADGYSTKEFAVFTLPLIMLGLHILVIAGISYDPKYHAIGRKPLTMAIWIVPISSLFLGAVVYMYAFGVNLSVNVIVGLLLGFVCVILGNYLPKCSPNYTLGIRVPWTLDNVDNWNHTHRFAGWTYTICGILTLAMSFLGLFWLYIGLLLLADLLPTLYSFIYYVRHKPE